MEITVKKMTVPSKLWKKMDIILQNSHRIGDHLYPFSAPVYDEDAGVFTDYDANDPDRTWAQIHFQTLLSDAIVRVHTPADDESITNVFFLENSAPAIVQSVHTVTSAVALSNNDHAKNKNRCKRLVDGIYGDRAQGLWESDGHYGPDDRKTFVAEMVSHWLPTRSEGREFMDLVENAKTHTRARVVIDY